MKALVALAATLAATAPLGAQVSTERSPVDRGSLLVAGSADLSHQSTSGGASATSISVAPNVLGFVRHGLALGGEVAFGYASVDQGHLSSIALGPAARYYFGDAKGRLLPFAGLAVLYAHSSTEEDAHGTAPSFSGSSDTWRVDGALGLTAMLARQVGLSGEAYLLRDVATIGSNLTADQTEHATRFGLRFGISAFVF